MNPKNLRFARLNLVQPLRYQRDDSLNLFDGRIPGLLEEGQEIIYSLILDSGRGQDFDPPPGGPYFAALLNAGRNRFGEAVEAGTRAPGGEWVDLPAGAYFFTQARELPGGEGITAMALELQKEGLWQRLQLENRIYLRYLFEDGSAVVQLFRPMAGET